VEPATVHGAGGVVITGESQHGKAAPQPSRLAADTVTGEFGPGSALTAMTGVGHAGMEQTTAAGARQTASGDRLDAHFAPGGALRTGAQGGAVQVQSAVLDGHVVLIQEPAAKPGAPAEAPMRATSGRAVYEGAGQWMHLTLGPRVENGGLQLTADRIDVSQESGDAFVHGNVKATWMDAGRQGKPANGSASQGSIALGGQGPAHVIAQEAQLHQASSEATFRGHARLWQQANSITGPLIVLDRQRQTLVAQSTDSAEPVRVVLLSATAPRPGGTEAGKSAAPSVIRLRGGDLKYSAVERKAVMLGAALGTVVAETSSATSVSNRVELTLLPPGNRAGKDGGQAQVDHLTASGRVSVTSQGRRGIGEQLAYSSQTGEYVLTGTTAAPPRMTDPARGTVTGEALIFHSRDDSVSIEGGGRKTKTETTAPR
jgi:lipopolysaccharide export system protein LptA